MSILSLTYKKDVSSILRKIVREGRINLTPEAALALVSFILMWEKNSQQNILNKIIKVLREKKFSKVVLDKQDVKEIINSLDIFTQYPNHFQEKKKYSTKGGKPKGLLQYLMTQKEELEEKEHRSEGDKIGKLVEIKAKEESKKEVPLIVSIKRKREVIEGEKELKDRGLQTKSIEFRLEVLYSPEHIFVTESYGTFKSMFVDRFNRLKRIFSKKGLRNIVSIEEAKSLNSRDEKFLILLVYDKRTVKNGNAGLIVGEDESGFVTVYVPFRNGLYEKFNKILLDSVIAIKFRKSSNDYIIAEDILFPEAFRDKKSINRSSEDVNVIFISDIHFGSKKFLEKSFENFIRFVNGEIDNPELNKISQKIGSILVLGDLVDGVGVYPNQQEELALFDINDQLDYAKKFLGQINSDIQVVIIPGNHDPAGKFIPQPPIPREFIEDILELPNIHFLGNPSYVSLNGVKTLLYHGQGLEDIAATLNMDVDKPTMIMVEQLRNRHILPMWGKEPILPLDRDLLLLEDVPDIFATGHLHTLDARITTMGNVLLLNSSTFQDLTSWQIKMGLKPTPGLFPIVNLKNFDLYIIKCDENGCELLKKIS